MVESTIWRIASAMHLWRLHARRERRLRAKTPNCCGDRIRYMEAHDSATDARVPILVLLDLRLPKVDGIDVLRQARGSETVWKQVPFVVLTTSRENRDIDAAYRLGVNSYIVKPVDFLAFADVAKTIKVYWLLTNEPPFPEGKAG